ncbi:MAG: rRNA pseudouridine synthase [Planctomycetes bacterium]|nr:rRNA pseudouridine synthase [Planctomycetota bacterium]
MRLHKYIAACGYTSRRRAELLIQAGRGLVNGKSLMSLGTTVKQGDVVTVNDEVLSIPEPKTVLFNKPPGIITSTHDTHERLTVMADLPPALLKVGILPIGRLDRETEGLLLMTNIGELNHRVTHPSYEIEKEYVALVNGKPAKNALEKIAAGVQIENHKTAPAKVLQTVPDGNNTQVVLVIHEGKKRQVRRMFEAVGYKVLRLARTRVGNIKLKGLEPCGLRDARLEELRGLGIDYDDILKQHSSFK